MRRPERGLRASALGLQRLDYFDGFAGLGASLVVAAGAGVESAGGDFFGGGFFAASARLRS
jgi:hypothetical protein